MIFRLLRTSRVEIVDILVLLFGNGVAVGWLYVIAKYGAVFPPVSPTLQVLAASGFELIILFWALDFLKAIRKGHWMSFLVFGCFLWLSPFLFTLQILQIKNFWLPVWTFLVVQGIVFMVYMLRRWTSFFDTRFWIRGVMLGILIGGLVVANHFFGILNAVVASGEKEVVYLKSRANRHAQQGRVLYERGDFTLAEEQFEKAVALYPRHKEAQASLGFIYSKEGAFDQAVEAFEKLIFIEPSGQNYIKMGLAFSQSENLPEAVAAWSRVPQDDPLYFQAKSLIEIAQKKAGDEGL
jgi:hypothetical protein